LLHRVVAAGVFALLAVAAARADQLETIKAKKEIVIGTEAQFAPFEFLQDGKIVGYGPDLMHFILQELPEVRVKQLDLPFQGILPGLAAKRFDFVVTSVTMTRERLAKFAFTVPIADATTALVKRKDDASIAGPDDIAGK